MSRYLEKTVAVTGVGMSEINRNTSVYPFLLAVDACRKAIADAGLKPEDIDGATCWPASLDGVGEGFHAAAISDIHATLGLKLNWYSSGEGAGQFGGINNAIAAVAAGYANHVLCWRALGQRYPDPTGGPAEPERLIGWRSWSAPYWAPSAVTWVSLHASVHMNRYGITREQMSAIPITLRRNAGLNPAAIYKDPLSFDQYMEARMISWPHCLYDCDVPCNGATAVIISRLDAAKDMPHKPVRFEAVGSAAYDRMDTWWARNDFPHMIMHDAAAGMWKRTDLKPKDVGSAHLYDGFTYLTMLWLEALGFCKEGEVGAFIEGGQRISIDGELPVNTNGGQLSEGRLHAFGHLHEAVVQLRGDAGARQVKDLKVSVAGVGGGGFGGALMLTNQT